MTIGGNTKPLSIHIEETTTRSLKICTNIPSWGIFNQTEKKKNKTDEANMQRWGKQSLSKDTTRHGYHFSKLYSPALMKETVEFYKTYAEVPWL